MKNRLYAAMAGGLPRCLISLAVATAASSILVAPAFAHEGRHVHDFEFEVGFEIEPAYESLPNGVWLRVTKPAAGHGEIFVSTPLENGATFEFSVPHDLEGQMVPFHSHLDPEAAGVIHVMPDAPPAERVEITIRNHAMEPPEVHVRPGTTIVWTNASDILQALTSGMHEDAGATGEHEHEDAVGVEGLQDTLQVEVTHLGSGASSVRQLQPVGGDAGTYRAPLIPTAPGQYRFRFFGTVKELDVDEVFESGPNTFDDIQDQVGIQFPTEQPSVRELVGVVVAAQQQAAEASNGAAAAGDDAAGARTIGIVGVVVGAVGIAAGSAGLALALRRRA